MYKKKDLFCLLMDRWIHSVSFLIFAIVYMVILICRQKPFVIPRLMKGGEM